jgi:uracil-DNA glycosylase family 4
MGYVMGAELPGDWRAEAASALAWWADAGVDLLVEDTPRDWFAAPLLPTALPPSPPVPADDVALPTDWEAFAAWRRGPASPEAGWRGEHLPASGPVPARVMVLVDCPDREDGPDSGLMSGSSGKLFDRMLAAIGLSRETVHLASLCGKRPMAGRTPREDEERLVEIARHHIGLVAPKRLLVMGDAASRALLTTGVQSARGRLHPLNHEAGLTEVVASFHPRFLLEKPAAKAEAWKDLQMLIGEPTT